MALMQFTVPVNVYHVIVYHMLQVCSCLLFWFVLCYGTMANKTLVNQHLKAVTPGLIVVCYVQMCQGMHTKACFLCVLLYLISISANDCPETFVYEMTYYLRSGTRLPPASIIGWWLTGKTHLWNDLLCLEWDVQLLSTYYTCWIVAVRLHHDQKKTSLQFSLHNVNKFRHSFVIFGMNHPEDLLY